MVKNVWTRFPSIPGVGTLRAYLTSVRTAVRGPVTELYPYKEPFITARTHGAPGLLWNKEVDEIVCTGCGACARECPDQCIFVKLKPYDGDKTDRRTIVDEFYIDLALCCYCAVCVEVCPYEAIEMTPEFAYAGYSPREMVLDTDELVALARGLRRHSPNPPRAQGAPKPLTDEDRARLKEEREAKARAKTRSEPEQGASSPDDPPRGAPET